MMKLTKTCASAAALATLLPMQAVSASGWVKLGRDSSGAVFEFDKASLKQRREKAVVLLRGEYSRVKTIPIRENRILYEFKCEDGTAARLSLKEFDASGDLVHAYTPPRHELTYDPVMKDTITEKLMRIACNVGAAQD